MRMRWVVLARSRVLATSCTVDVHVDDRRFRRSTGRPCLRRRRRPATTLADGSRPARRLCGQGDRRTQTVAFVARRACWALDPTTGTLPACSTSTDPGPFAFGPQGDRVLLADMQVQGLGPKEPTWPSKGSTPSVFDWGHPLGLAIVYANGARAQPAKRFMDDGHVERLSTLPAGTYQAIAYHPSGLALGFIVDEGDRQGIWLSHQRGEGSGAARLLEAGHRVLLARVQPGRHADLVDRAARGRDLGDPLDGPRRPHRVRDDPDARACADRARAAVGALGSVARRHAGRGVRRRAGDDRRR